MRNLKAWYFALGFGIVGGVGVGGYFAYQAATKSNPELSAGTKANSKAEAERMVAQADRHESTGAKSGATETTHQKAKAGAPSKKGSPGNGHEASVGSQAANQANSYAKGVGPKNSHPTLAAHQISGKSASQAAEDEESDEDVALSHPVAKKDSAGTPSVGHPSEHATTLSGHPSSGVQSCASVEEFGAAPEQVLMTPEMWEKTMAVFHEAKARVVTWVSQQGAQLTREQKVRAIKSVEEVRLQRPPQAEQPDLSWRGIGVYTIMMDAAKLPQGVIRLGGGFVRLVQRDVGRARFELTRLVLQAVTPCELERVLGGERTAFWKPVQSCLNVETHSQECTLGGFSESTWALSSAVAAQVSPPGCQIANLTPEILGRCVASGTPSPAAHASAEQAQAVGQVWSSLFGGFAPLISQGLLVDRSSRGREVARVLARGTTHQVSAARGESLK